jgi:hypothetical protein
MADSGHKRVDEALDDWRDAERTLQAAVREREAAEDKTRSMARVEETVEQSAADAEVTAVAALQAQRSADEALTAVAEVSGSAKDELARAAAAEEAAREAHDAARAEHRAAQDAAVRRYRDDQPFEGDGSAVVAERAADEVPEPGTAG